MLLLFAVNIAFLLFFLAWFILGNVWYFEADGCDDFEAGYILTLVLIIFMYITVFAICCMCFCMICCASIAMAAGQS